MLASIGIVKGQPFKAEDRRRVLPDKAAKTATARQVAGNTYPGTWAFMISRPRWHARRYAACMKMVAFRDGGANFE